MSTIEIVFVVSIIAFSSYGVYLGIKSINEKSMSKKYCIFEINKENKKHRYIDAYDDYNAANDMCQSMNNFRTPDMPVYYCMRCLTPGEFKDISNYSPFLRPVTIHTVTINDDRSAPWDKEFLLKKYQVIKLFVEGQPVSEIAAKTDAARQTVMDIITNFVLSV